MLKPKMQKCLVFLFIFTSVLFIECKKRLFDYRNKFVGEWKFNRTMEACSFGPQSCSTTMSEFSGTIEYTKQLEKDDIIINWGDGSNQITFVKITKSGEFKSGSGKFSDKNNVSFTVFDHWGHSSIDYTITGTKTD